jgi:transcriptional regulator with XRE-family HTH domain
MITGRQIRAARGLLRWSCPELADKAGLTRETINKIEADAIQPREGTMDDLLSVFDRHGVEFTENEGVRIKPHGVEVLVGQAGLQQFFNNVHAHVRDHGGKIVQLGIDENLFWAMGKEFSEAHRKRMAKLVQERKDIQVQAILSHGDTNFIASDYNHYRWISKDIFAPVPFYIYGPTLAVMDFHTIPAPTIVVLKFPAITEAYRKQFTAFWELSEEPDVAIKQKVVSKSRKK